MVYGKWKQHFSKVVDPRDHWPTGGCSCSGQHCEEACLHCASLGKDPNSKFEVQCLLNVHCFHTIITWKTPKSNHGKSGIICSWEVTEEERQKTSLLVPVIFAGQLILVSHPSLGSPYIKGEKIMPVLHNWQVWVARLGCTLMRLYDLTASHKVFAIKHFISIHFVTHILNISEKGVI